MWQESEPLTSLVYCLTLLSLSIYWLVVVELPSMLIEKVVPLLNQ